MCRLTAYLGPSVALRTLVIDPVHSLVQQSQEALEAKLSLNGDGFGMAWYDRAPEPGLFKDPVPAWSDQNLLSLCTHIHAPVFLAHVRASTQGGIARANCHPFTHGCWSFMHNGQTRDFPIIRRRLEADLPTALYQSIKGQTDSELLFMLLIAAGLKTDPAQAFERVLASLYEAYAAEGARPFIRLTCVLSDGNRLLAYRHASDKKCPTLYVSKAFCTDAIVLASEPLSRNRDSTWSEVPPNRLVVFKHQTSGSGQ